METTIMVSCARSFSPPKVRIFLDAILYIQNKDKLVMDTPF